MKKLIYDWNKAGLKDQSRYQKIGNKRIEINDETLRDGLQATYVSHPSLKEKIQLLQWMEKLGIDSANLGFPVAGTVQKNDILALAQYAKDNKFAIELGCGGRILKGDVEEIINVSQKVGKHIEAGLFIASSEIRHIIERWDKREIAKLIKESVSLAVRNGLSVMFVTEDTTRADPQKIAYLYNHAINSGATRICICDTVGFALPWGVQKLITFVKDEVIKGNRQVKIDWHGHNDRGLATINALVASYCGVDRIQATAMGVGERAGNTSIVEILVNLQMDGLLNKDLTALSNYTSAAARVLRYPIRANDPIIGTDVFRTATGVHAAAIVKARAMNHKDAEVVYSSVDPYIVGKKHEILVGPMSGKSNAEWALKELGITPSASLVQKILNKAKSARKILTEKDVEEIANASV